VSDTTDTEVTEKLPPEVLVPRAKLRLVVDARLWRGGIGRYVFNLLSSLHKLDSRIQLTAIVWSEATGPLSKLVYETRLVKSPIYTIREQFRIPWEARGCDLLHIPHYNVPLLYRGPLVVTIHDLTHLTEPAFRNSPEAWIYARPMLHVAARKSAHVITDSQYSRQEIITRLGVPPDKVSVIYHGVSDHFCVRDKEQAFSRMRALVQIDQPFVLYVGNFKPHKNLSRLLRAFALLRSKRWSDHLLVLAGDDPKYRGSVLAECSALGMSKNVRHIPWVPDEMLPDLYSAADLAVIPSTSEGFGHPLLEAMACGTPVACSNAASLPEIGGNSVMYFNPYRVEEIAAVIGQLLDSPSLREKLKDSGLGQAAKFSWDECARRHIEVYRKVLSV
jgi:glycosyltransferase involved in cell wall biosynthesis